MEIHSIPHDQRVPVIIHEIIPETHSFIHPCGYVSFIRDRPEELSKIETIDQVLKDDYERISVSPPMMHVQAGKALLAYYQDAFYRGFCLRVLGAEAEVWFAEYGNIAHVKKTDLRTLPKAYFSYPAVSHLGRLDLPPTRLIHGNAESQVVEDFNRKITGVEDRKADVISSAVHYAPFKISSIDVVFGTDYSSFLTLLSNKSRLDWGFSPTPSSLMMTMSSSTFASPRALSQKSVGSPPSRLDSSTSSNCGTLPGSYPHTPNSPVASAATAETPTSIAQAQTQSANELSDDLSSLNIGAEVETTSPLREPSGHSSVKKNLFDEGHRPKTIEGCHRRIDELETRLKTVEDILSKLTAPSRDDERNKPETDSESNKSSL